MSWRQYTVKVSLRGSSGKRATASRRVNLYAHSHEEAVTKAKEQLVNAATYEVRAG